MYISLEVVKLSLKHPELSLRSYLFIPKLLDIFEHKILLVRESDSSNVAFVCVQPDWWHRHCNYLVDNKFALKSFFL
jgi:hypothetical protein